MSRWRHEVQFYATDAKDSADEIREFLNLLEIDDSRHFLNIKIENLTKQTMNNFGVIISRKCSCLAGINTQLISCAAEQALPTHRSATGTET